MNAERVSIIQEKHRPGTIAVAAILLFISGFIGLIGGGFIVVLAPSMTRIVEVNVASFYAFLGVLIMIISIGELISGWLLWNLKRSGAYIAITAIIVSLLLSVIKPPGVGDLEYIASLVVGVVFDVLILVFIALGWHALE